MPTRKGSIATMRLSQGIPAASAATVSLATLGLLVQDSLARPHLESKADWVRNGHGRKAVSDVLKGKRDARLAHRSDNTTSCADTGATAITAPKINLWNQMEGAEAADLLSWLFAQPELNLTVSEQATSWDNTM